MKKEPTWMEDIRQQMKKTRFYGKLDQEMKMYEENYLNVLETLDLSQAEAIRRYVEQLQKCEFHHIRIAYLQGMEDEKAHHRARKRDFYRLITENNILNTAVVMKTADYLQSNTDFAKRQEAFEALKQRYYSLLRTLPEEDRALVREYQQALVNDYEIMFHIAAGFPKGMI